MSQILEAIRPQDVSDIAGLYDCYPRTEGAMNVMMRHIYAVL